MKERLTGGMTGAKVDELRRWQAERLARTYSDLHRDPRYSKAVEFFQTDLYGTQDVTRRDRDLERALTYLRRALPRGALSVLVRAIELDVLTAELDEAVAEQLPHGPITPPIYAAAYRAAGRSEARQQQIELILGIGRELDRIVRHPWVGLALHAAHTPARAAGFGALQEFLERGYTAFRRMKGAQMLLEAIEDRETRLMRALLHGEEAVVGVCDEES